MAETKQNTIFGTKLDDKKKKFVVPYKKTMNLVTVEDVFNWKKMTIILAVIIIASVVFVKFGILDPISEKRDAEELRSLKQLQLAKYNAQMVEYAKVEEKYGRYSYGWMNASESSMLQKEQVLDVLETIIAPACIVENTSVSNNTMTLSVRGVTLDEAREIVKQLKADPRVSSAMVYSAVTADETHAAKISMTVIFTKEAAEK